MDIASFEKLIEKEIRSISQADILQAIDSHRVPLRIENREWDYSETFTEYPCFIALEDKSTNTAVAYCEKGFGPTHPWGLIFIEGENMSMSMGMDCGWFMSLEDAIRESMFWHGENPENYEVQ